MLGDSLSHYFRFHITEKLPAGFQPLLSKAKSYFNNFLDGGGQK